MFQILVVEDDKSSARLMKAVLEHAGYEVFEAGKPLHLKSRGNQNDNLVFYGNSLAVAKKLGGELLSISGI